MRVHRLILAIILAAAWLLPPQGVSGVPEPVTGTSGMAVTAHAMATSASLVILRRGGNAVDAAVAGAFVLGVVEPYSSGIGGGGFMVLRDGISGEATVLDYRETAPAKASRGMFLDEEGEVIPNRSTTGGLSVATPGFVAGMALALGKHGRMKMAEVLEPAIAAAEQGFRADARFAAMSRGQADRLREVPESARLFLRPGGGPCQAGDLIVQRDLAATMRAIAVEGPEAFYTGTIARRIAAEIKTRGGVLSEEDLADYKAKVREPLVGEYRGYEILTMPPPSSGGVHLIQMLNMLSAFDLHGMGRDSAQAIHLTIETERRAYADRAEFLGDPDFADVPVEGLTSKRYAAALRAQLRMDRAAPSAEVRAGTPAAYESPDTTHLCVMDASGSAVSMTNSINYTFGSAVTVPGTGILLNNHMDDFSIKPGVPNLYGLVGGEANAIAPGKRPLSSMTPTILVKRGRARLVVGSPGGSRIITTVLQVISNVLDHGMNPAEAVAAPRYHHQWLPDVVYMEERVCSDAARKELEALGHKIELGGAWSNAMAIWVEDETGMLQGAADPRGVGTAAGE
ncbi:gamma-glutamyltransferase [Candidatus Poribacteria bacterium]|nr:gamma-glutamyltransferase [Candidatus Poribacteria bacterium]